MRSHVGISQIDFLRRALSYGSNIYPATNAVQSAFSYDFCFDLYGFVITIDGFSLSRALFPLHPCSRPFSQFPPPKSPISQHRISAFHENQHFQKNEIQGIIRKAF
ncbi:hypothetical protein DIZ76_010306 [Coccidioides immitis]|nr:hypothetical protein DIZ76_010306 [Coccidioides immitis]